MISDVSCLGGAFKLPSGKVVCHITTTKTHEERKLYCQQLGYLKCFIVRFFISRLLEFIF